MGKGRGRTPSARPDVRLSALLLSWHRRPACVSGKGSANAGARPPLLTRLGPFEPGARRGRFLLIDKGDVAESIRQAGRLPASAKGRRLYLHGRALLAQRQPTAAVVALLRANGEPDLPPGVAAGALVKAYGERRGRGAGQSANRASTEQALALLALTRATEGHAEEDRRVAALVKGARPAARAEALAALEALPGGSAMTALERLRLGRLYEDEGRWADARKQYAALVAADRDNPSYLAVLVEGLLRQKKRAEAAGWLERLEKLEPASPRTKRLREQMRKAEARSED